MSAKIYPVFRRDRAEEILEHIKSRPKSWNQTSWHCFGGLAQIKSGQPADNATVRRDARLWLGITAYEADRLFAEHNTIADIECIIAEIDGGYDVDGDDYDRYGYDRYGYNRYGYNRDGYNRYGYNRYGYNRDGRDRDGYDRYGYNRDGYDRDGYDSYGYDRDGYDRDGLRPGNLI